MVAPIEDRPAAATARAHASVPMAQMETGMTRPKKRCFPSEITVAVLLGRGTTDRGRPVARVAAIEVEFVVKGRKLAIVLDQRRTKDLVTSVFNTAERLGWVYTDEQETGPAPAPRPPPSEIYR